MSAPKVIIHRLDAPFRQERDPGWPTAVLRVAAILAVCAAVLTTITSL